MTTVAPPRTTSTPLSRLLATTEAARRLGRALTAGERAIDIPSIERTLREEKQALDAAIRAEAVHAATTAHAFGYPVRMRVTDAMLDALSRLAAAGARHATDEIRALGKQPARSYTATLDDLLRPLRAKLAGGLPAIEVRIEEQVTSATLSAAPVSALIAAVERIAGPLDLASRLAPGAFDAGLRLAFDESADLFLGWAYSAILDGATCDECAAKDGTVYATLDEAEVDLPGGGPNPSCYGDGRCRCRLVPLDDDEARAAGLTDPGDGGDGGELDPGGDLPIEPDVIAPEAPPLPDYLVPLDRLRESETLRLTAVDLQRLAAERGGANGYHPELWPETTAQTGIVPPVLREQTDELIRAGDSILTEAERRAGVKLAEVDAVNAEYARRIDDANQELARLEIEKSKWAVTGRTRLAREWGIGPDLLSDADIASGKWAKIVLTELTPPRAAIEAVGATDLDLITQRRGILNHLTSRYSYGLTDAEHATLAKLRDDVQDLRAEVGNLFAEQEARLAGTSREVILRDAIVETLAESRPLGPGEWEMPDAMIAKRLRKDASAAANFIRSSRFGGGPGAIQTLDAIERRMKPISSPREVYVVSGHRHDLLPPGFSPVQAEGQLTQAGGAQIAYASEAEARLSGVSGSGIIVRVELPAGTPAWSVPATEASAHELIVLPRGTLFRIEKVEALAADTAPRVGATLVDAPLPKPPPAHAELTFLKGTAKKAREAITKASEFLPRDWIAASERRGSIVGKWDASRAHYNDAQHLVKTDDAPGAWATSLHETTHRMEYTLPGMTLHEWAFYNRRIRWGDYDAPAEPARKLGEIFPRHNYKSYEVAREDEFFHAYAGKDYSRIPGYSNYGREWRGSPEGPYELMTMGVEALLGETPNAAFYADREYLSWVIGMMGAL